MENLETVKRIDKVVEEKVFKVKVNFISLKETSGIKVGEIISSIAVTAFNNDNVCKTLVIQEIVDRIDDDGICYKERIVSATGSWFDKKRIAWGIPLVPELKKVPISDIEILLDGCELDLQNSAAMLLTALKKFGVKGINGRSYIIKTATGKVFDRDTFISNLNYKTFQKGY